MEVFDLGDAGTIFPCNCNEAPPDDLTEKNLGDPYGTRYALVKANMFVDTLIRRGFDPSVISLIMFKAALFNASDNGLIDDFQRMCRGYIESCEDMDETPTE